MTPEHDETEGSALDAGEEMSIEGTAMRTPMGPGWEFLRLLTGWAALMWVGRAIGWLLGYRHEVELVLVDGAIRVLRERRLLGRVVRKSRETWTRRALASVGQRTGYRGWHLYVGSLMLALGVVIGGVYFVDGVRTGETYLLLVGAGAILIGGGLDFALHVLMPHAQGRSAIDVRMLPRHGVSLHGLTTKQADRFVDAVALGAGGK